MAGSVALETVGCCLGYFLVTSRSRSVAALKARLDSADMSYEGFKVPRHETQLPDGTLKPGAVHTMTSSGLTEIPVSAWTPDRLDHMPTPEEFQVRVLSLRYCMPAPNIQRDALGLLLEARTFHRVAAITITKQTQRPNKESPGGVTDSR